MKKIFIITVFTMLSLIYADCLGDNPGEVYFNAFTKDGNDHYTVQSLYKTTNYGQTAQVVCTNFNATIFKDKAPGVFYKIPLGSESLYISKDTCKTWQWQSVIVGVGESFRSGVFQGECSDGRRFSTDYGKTWTTYPWSGVTGGIYSWCLGLTQGEIYTYPYNQKLYRSTDYGDNFTMVNDTLNLGSAGVNHGWQAGELLLGATGKVYRSNDYGQTFNFVCAVYDSARGGVFWGMTNGEMYSIKVNRFPQMFYDQMTIKFYYSTNYGQTCTEYFSDYTNSISDETSQQATLLNAYPNPFNSQTHITYSLDQSGLAEISLFNTKGEQIRILEKGLKLHGDYTVNVNATDLPSGVYFVKLQINKTKMYKQLLLLK